MHFDRPSDLVAWTFGADLGNDTDNEVMRVYYTSFRRSFGPLRRHKYDLQLDHLTALVRSGQVKKVLDIGCGCGSVSLWLALQGADVTGIDLEEERLRVGRRRAEMLGVQPVFVQKNINELDGQYDAIWIEQAYHHLEPRAEVQAKIASLLRPGGHLIISESNAWNPLVQAQAIKARGFKTIHVREDVHGVVHQYGEERITTSGALTRGFARHGIKRTGQRYFGILPNSPRFESLAFVEKMVPPFIAPAFSHYLWEGRKVA